MLPNVADFFGPHRDVYLARVTVNYRKKGEATFFIAGWKCDDHNPRNPCLMAIRPSIVWRGEVMVFSRGKRVEYKADAMGQKPLVEKAVGM